MAIEYGKIIVPVYSSMLDDPDLEMGLRQEASDRAMYDCHGARILPGPPEWKATELNPSVGYLMYPAWRHGRA